MFHHSFECGAQSSHSNKKHAKPLPYLVTLLGTVCLCPTQIYNEWWLSSDQGFVICGKNAPQGFSEMSQFCIDSITSDQRTIHARLV